MTEGNKSDAARREEEILAFWKERRIFEKTLEQDAPAGDFVFYDGPPFATGLPHPGHFLASTSKDLVPRYKTMRGYRVRRRWGWDTHGLPIESLVEKELGLKNKKEILELGIEKFNETARSMVLGYVHDWKRYIERLGRWVDFDNSYKTMDTSYMESVWWALKQIHEKGHLYEGRKVLMYCPHCETPLAKAEIAMDNTYKDITEEAVTVKFKVKNPEAHGLPQDTYLLAWTTTPWTLPGNVALAVGLDITYAVAVHEGATVVLAKDLLEANGISAVEREVSGSELVGLEYEPLYAVAKVAAYEGKKWQVLPAEFVTTTDGTGIVHTAVIYGEDDYQLGVKEGLPMVPILNPNATYNSDAPEFLVGQYIKKAEALIKDDLTNRGLLFKKAPNTHSYPHCYRCGTPLIYNAVSSWFIDIQAVKDRLLAENENITWSPEHLKHGRFKHIVENAPDWTISRNRFWATPLPIWKDAQGKVRVIGSLSELAAHTKKSGNRYFAMRHGEAENTVARILSSDRDANPLTEAGREVSRAAAERFRGVENLVIYASPLRRTRETAAEVAKALGFDESVVRIDERLHELTFGEFEGKSLDLFLAWRNAHEYDSTPEGGESYADARRRFGEFLYEIEEQEEGKTVLIVTHGIGLESLSVVAEGLTKEAARERIWGTTFAPGAVLELPFTPLPHNADYEVDLHLPYIDRIELVDEEGNELMRIPEVVDCWVESGSMPFAEFHYPFEHKELYEKRSVGDFISEYIGQTRAWFYYMHVMSVGLFDHAPFRNVVTTGTIVASDGQKLSKSKKNYTDPYELFDIYSADAFRFYLMASVVMLAEDLTFRDEDVKEAQQRVVNMVRNVHSFYELFKEERDPSFAPTHAHALDRWILSRLEEMRTLVTDSLDRYDTVHGARAIREFIDDLSTWYVRRSRDRVKQGGEDTKEALATLHLVLKTLALVMAPYTPFLSEEIYQSLREESDPESVHLAKWPDTVGVVDAELHAHMERARAIASTGLKQRQIANIKVRQPLAEIRYGGVALPEELAEIVAQEVNVKKVASTTLPDGEVELATELTPELIREGDQRAFMRALAEARKELNLVPKDQVRVGATTALRELLEGISLPGVSEVSVDETGDRTVELSTGSATFSVTKV